MRPAAAALLLTLLVATASGCGLDSSGAQPAATRGYLVISIDGLRPDRLGAYGGSDRASPFFDQLAARGVLFEGAFAQSPATLTSQVSLFTGLYPAEHGVRPPLTAPSPALDWLPERFARFGFRTAGHTEGGFVGRHFGFHRGFDEFSDSPARAAGRTFQQGLDFLKRLDPDERFFLFLQTYALHAPYEEPGPSDAEPGPPLTGAYIRSVNRGFQVPGADEVASFSARYDRAIRHLDQLLEEFFAELGRLGLDEDTTVVVTSDHGEELWEHGRLGHSQVYPESLRVPLLVLHPEVGGRRVTELVELIDLAPTLYDLADLPPPAVTSGVSLAPLLTGGRGGTSWAYAESVDGPDQRTLLRRREGITLQHVTTSLAAEPDGTWVTRSAGVELPSPEAPISLVSFHRPRTIRASLEDAEPLELTVGTGWTPMELDLPADRRRYRLDLTTAGCESPLALGLSEDPRCLSFKVRGVEMKLGELFHLDVDPLAQRDVASQRLAAHRELAERLAELSWPRVAAPRQRPLNLETREALRALDYLD